MTNAFLTVVVATAIVAMTFKETSALKCWVCSSDASNAEFCDDPFDEIAITQVQWAYVECSLPPKQINPDADPNTQSIAVCKKVKQLVNDKPVIIRSCSWQDINAAEDSCFNDTAPSNVITEYCKTCKTDGCNSW